MASSRSIATRKIIAGVAVILCMAAGVAWRIRLDDAAMGNGHPELRLRLRPDATVQEGLGFLAERIGSGDQVKKITVEDRKVTVRFETQDFREAACALRGSPERNAVFRQEGVTFDISAMCAFHTEQPRP